MVNEISAAGIIVLAQSRVGLPTFDVSRNGASRGDVLIRRLMVAGKTSVARRAPAEGKPVLVRRKTYPRSQPFEPSQIAPVRLPNMITLPPGFTSCELFRHVRAVRRKNATASRERQGDAIRYFALIIKAKLAHTVARHQWARRFWSTAGVIATTRASEVSQYLHPMVELITISADVEKSQRGSLRVAWWRTAC